MTRAITGCVFLSVFAVIVTVLYYAILPSDIEAVRHALGILNNKASALSARHTEYNNKLNTLTQTVDKCLLILATLQTSLQSNNSSTLSTHVGSAASSELDTDASEEVVPASATQELPIPMLPQSLVRKTLKDLLNDEQVNPKKTVPDRMGKARLQVELARAQAQIEVLSSEIGLELLKSMQELAAAGEFVDYPSGSPPPTANDASLCSVAEALPSGQRRMYFLARERFPDLFNMREERRVVAREALNRIVQLLAE
jgi:hypothetical protein